MNALNIKTGETRAFQECTDAREAVRYAFLSTHVTRFPVLHTEFLRVEPRGSIGWALGDWFAFSVVDPALELKNRKWRRKGADIEARAVVIADRRQRRKARAGYLQRQAWHRNKILNYVFELTLRARGLKVTL